MSTNQDYNAPVATDDIAGQIQRVFDRRVQGNKLVTAPVTYWHGFYTTQRVYFVSNTYPPVAAVIVSFDTWKLGPFDKANRKAFTVEITEENHPFFSLGEQIDRVSPNQLTARNGDRQPCDDACISGIDTARLARVR